MQIVYVALLVDALDRAAAIGRHLPNVTVLYGPMFHPTAVEAAGVLCEPVQGRAAILRRLARPGTFAVVDGAAWHVPCPAIYVRPWVRPGSPSIESEVPYLPADPLPAVAAHALFDGMLGPRVLVRDDGLDGHVVRADAANLPVRGILASRLDLPHPTIVYPGVDAVICSGSAPRYWECRAVGVPSWHSVTSAEQEVRVGEQVPISEWRPEVPDVVSDRSRSAAATILAACEDALRPAEA